MYRLANAGTEPAHVFTKITVPTAKGAVLEDGTIDPTVYDFQVSDDWMPEADEVYYGGVLEPGTESTTFISTLTFSN